MQDLSALQKVGMLFRAVRDMRTTPMSLANARMLIQEDGVAHTIMRNLVNRGFTPRRVKAWEDRISELVAQSMKRIEQQEVFDLVQELAIPLPVSVIAEWLGVEPDKQATFKRWSDDIIQNATGSAMMMQTDKNNPLWTAMREMRAYMRPIVKARRNQPSDDLISILAHADGDAKLSDYEIFLFILLLLIAGNETTTNLLGNAVDALIQHPDQLDLVVENPSLIPGLVEETLRWDSPIQFITRYALEEVEIEGVVIPKDSMVNVLLGSGNRDERFWEDPDRFDVT